MGEVVPIAPDDLIKYTYNKLIYLWLDNFAHNLPQIREGLDINDLPKREGEACLCVGAGPSLSKFHHLEKIKQTGWKHPILVCDRILKNCLEHGIVPYAVASVDGSPLIAKYYKSKIVKKHMDKINAIFNVTVHPSVVNQWKGKIHWFTAMLDMPGKPKGKINTHSMSFFLHVMSGYKNIMSAIGNVGSTIWNVGYVLGCNPICLVGYDFSEQVNDKAKAIYFKSFTAMYLQKFKGDVNKAMDKAADLHQVEHNPDFDNYYLINPIWKRYRATLASHIISSGYPTVNCTEGGCLHTEAIKCDNFTAMSLEKALEKWR